MTSFLAAADAAYTCRSLSPTVVRILTIPTKPREVQTIVRGRNNFGNKSDLSRFMKTRPGRTFLSVA